MATTPDDDTTALLEATDRIFADLIDDDLRRQVQAGQWPQAAWDALAAQGLVLALVAEADGGIGVPIAAGLELVRLAGYHAVPLPLVETMLANHVLAAAGLPISAGPACLVMSAGLVITDEGGVRGAVHRVGWGRQIRTLAILTDDGRCIRIDGGWMVTGSATTLTGLPSDTLTLDAHGVVGRSVADAPLAKAATLRTLQIAGALDRLVTMTRTHVSERVQFGKPLAAFQVVQHEMAKLAAETAAAGVAADLAAAAFVDPANSWPPIAAAKIRSGEAATRGVAIAHQLHGAIGVTAEHALHHFTGALLAWRDDAGGERYWADRLGRTVIAAGQDAYWPMVTAA